MIFVFTFLYTIFSGDRNQMSLPKDASIIHAEFIYYYYPSDYPFPCKYNGYIFGNYYYSTMYFIQSIIKT